MSLELELGPMFAGKSTALISKLTRYADVGLPCLYINHTKDIRLTESSDQVVSTHNSTFQKLSHKIKGIKITSLGDISVEEYEVIGIDEGQFFSDNNEGETFVEFVEIIRDWVLYKNKKVIIASLDSDFKLRPFGGVHYLLGLCGKGGLTKHVAICLKCDPGNRNDAPYSMRITGGDSIVESGGSDKYVPVCMKCYKKYNKYW